MAQIVMVPRSPVPVPPLEVEVPEVEMMASPASPYAHAHRIVKKQIHVPHDWRDPWNDYKRWYQMTSLYMEMTISEYDLNYKLWDISELHEKIDSLAGIVLVQPVGDNAWKIAFKAEESHRVFWDWYGKLSKEHKMTVLVPLADHKDCENWIKEHVKGNYTLTNNGYDGGRVRIHVVIRDVNEAMEFKLRWYNVPEPEPA